MELEQVQTQIRLDVVEIELFRPVIELFQMAFIMSIELIKLKQRSTILTLSCRFSYEPLFDPLIWHLWPHIGWAILEVLLE